MLHTLTRKVTVAVLVFLALVAGAAAVVITNIVLLRGATAHLTEETTTRLELIGDFNTNLTRAVLEVTSYADSRQDKDLDEGQEALAVAQTNLAKLDELLGRSQSSTTGLELDYAPVEERRQALLTSVRQEFDAVVEGIEANDDAAIDRALTALDALEGDAEQLEEDVDILLEQDVAQSSEAVTTRAQLGIFGISGLVGLVVLLMLLAMLLLQRQVVQPTRRLAVAAGALAAGNREQVRVTSNDEIGDLQRAFNTMAVTIEQQTTSLEQQVAAAQAARAEAERAHTALAEQLDMVEAQRTVIRTMSVPILPLTTTTMVMPLVGALDSDRLRLVQEQVLQTLSGSSVRCMILDITGVPIVDAPVAQGLVQVVSAARLLGAEVVWVGIRPEVAQALVGLGLDLAHVPTRSTLQSGIAYALARQ